MRSKAQAGVVDLFRDTEAPARVHSLPRIEVREKARDVYVDLRDCM